MEGISAARQSVLARQAMAEMWIEAQVRHDVDTAQARCRPSDPLRRRFLDETMVTVSGLALAAGLAR
jgi:hypothetical protein